MSTVTLPDSGFANPLEEGPTHPLWRPFLLVRALYRSLDLLIAVLLMLASLNLRVALWAGPNPYPPLSFLDNSWHLDMGFKAQQGIWFGKDVAYTYGPILQWLNAAAPRMRGLSLGAFFKSFYVFPVMIAFALLFASARLLLRNHAPWKRALYLLVMAVFWPSDDWVRSAFMLFAFVTVVALISRRDGTWQRPLMVSAVILIGFLISADTGIYAVVGLAIAVFSDLLLVEFAKEQLRIHFRTVLWVLAFTVAGVLIINAVFGTILDFHFWKSSFAIAEVYRWSLSAPIPDRLKLQAIKIALGCLTIMACAWCWRDLRARSLVRQPVFLLSAALFSLAALQSGVIRSDWGHVAMALYPGIALTAAVLMGNERKARYLFWGDLPVLSAVVLTAIVSGPTPPLTPQAIFASLNWRSIYQSHGCPTNSYELDDACLVRADFERINPVMEYVQSHTAPQEPLLIFPNENIYGDVSRRRVSGKVLQNCLAIGSWLSALQIQGYEMDKPRIGVYSDDRVSSFDRVANFTRSPEMWFYVQKHYASIAESSPGVLLLQRDDQRAADWRMNVQSLNAHPISILVKNHAELDLGDIHWPNDADFLRLRIRLHYPFWWKILKPSQASVTLRFANGKTRTARVLVAPDRTYDVWVVPWEETDLERYFARDALAWRVPPRNAPVTHLGLKIDKLDSFSVLPVAAVVSEIDAARIYLK